MLLIGGRRADALVAEAGDTPLFVYDLGSDRRRRSPASARPFRERRSALCHKSKSLSARCSSHVAKQVDGLDIASARRAGAGARGRRRPARRSASPAPASATRELDAAIAAGVTLNLRIRRRGRARAGDRRRARPAPRLAVRVNPDFEIKGSGMRMGGGAKPFGVDAERVPALVRRILAAGADWRGFHIFAGSQALDAEALIDAQAADRRAGRASSPTTIGAHAAAGQSRRRLRHPLFPRRAAARRRDGRRGAFGERSPARPPILARHPLRDRARPLAGRRGGRLSDPDRRPEGQPRQDLPGHRRRHAPPARRLGQFRPGGPPQLSGRDRHAASAPRPRRRSSIVGCLCTPLDRLADDVMMPRAEVGDLVAVFLAGAYGLSASPQAFLAQQPAREMAVGGGD